jgi:Eukaryotic protein of unknown function (DUF866)
LFFVGANVRIKNISIQGIWKCIGVDSGTQFPEVDLDEGEWVDYDEKVAVPFTAPFRNPLTLFVQAALPVGISEIKSHWARA